MRKAKAEGRKLIQTIQHFSTLLTKLFECWPWVVMGHVGFVPRKSISIGGLRAVKTTAAETTKLYRNCKRPEEAGAFAVESEVIAGSALTEIAQRTSIICVSLGSGTGGEVSFLIKNDLCGEIKGAPRNARVFGDLGAMHKAVHSARIGALSAFKTYPLRAAFQQRTKRPGLENGLEACLNATEKI